MNRLILPLLMICFTIKVTAQSKNFIDQPYLETMAKVDTLVTPDRIYISIFITEKDTKGKVSVEEQENKMAASLKSLNIDIDKQLSLKDMSTNFKKYFLKQQDVHKAKSYSLLVYDGLTAGNVMLALEKIEISNVGIEKVAYSKMEELQLKLKSNAILKSKQNAEYLLEPLGQKIIKAIHISDQYNNYRVASVKNSAIRIKGSSSDTEYKPLDIEFEKIKIERTVSVKFAIE